MIFVDPFLLEQFYSVILEAVNCTFHGFGVSVLVQMILILYYVIDSWKNRKLKISL